MRIHKPGQWAVGTLVLFLGAGLALRGLPGRASSAPRAPLAEAAARPTPPASPTAGALPPSGSSAGTLALGWMERLEKRGKHPARGPEDELVRSEDRQFAQELATRLRRSPDEWGALLEVLSQEDTRHSRRIVQTLKDAVDDASEAALIQQLRSGRHRETRISSASLLSGRTSPESLAALICALKEDPDAGVRYSALSELAVRQGRMAPGEPADLIEELIRERAQADSDPELRQAALRMTARAPSGR